jgi:metallophosphoesterase superfamily enzyme
MIPITNDLKRVLREEEVHAILINGDISYDLDTNNGTNYEEFLQLLEQVSAKTPIIHVPGNH